MKSKYSTEIKIIDIPGTLSDLIELQKFMDKFIKDLDQKTNDPEVFATLKTYKRLRHKIAMAIAETKVGNSSWTRRK